MQKHIIAIVAVAAIFIAWLFRYDLETGGEHGSAHVLDRWTGNVTWYRGPEFTPAYKAE